jgi:hypothetical protein
MMQRRHVSSYLVFSQCEEKLRKKKRKARMGIKAVKMNQKLLLKWNQLTTNFQKLTEQLQP